MISALKILAVAALWYIKSSSLLKFYFSLKLLHLVFGSNALYVLCLSTIYCTLYFELVQTWQK